MSGSLTPSHPGWRDWLLQHLYPILFLALALATGVPFVLKQNSEWEEVYVRAADRFVAGEDIYVQPTNYTYPPFMAVATVPFTWMPPTAARVAWLVVEIASLWFLIYSAWTLCGGKPIDGRDPTARGEHLVFFLGIACGIRFCLNCVSHHQTDLLIAALALGGCVALLRGRSVLSGIGFGLATAIKGPALLWIGFLLYRREWKSAAVMIVVAASASLLPDLFRRPPTHSLWVERWVATQVLEGSGSASLPGAWKTAPELNQSIAGGFFRAFGCRREWIDGEYRASVITPPTATPTEVKRYLYPIYLAILASMGGVLLFVRRKDRDSSRAQPSAFAWEASLFALLALLISPMSGKAHFGPILLPAFCLARIAIYEARVFSRVMLAVSIVLFNVGWEFLGQDAEFLSLWYGSITLGTVTLFVGCLYERSLPLRRGSKSEHVRLAA